MMCLLISYIWLFQNILTQVQGQFYYCNDAYSCYGQSLSVSSSVDCNGYHSCGNADVVSSGFQLHCAGSYACFAATRLTASYVTHCSGLFSCAYVNSTFTSGSYTYCSGEQSCMNSIIYDNRGIECIGTASCYGATLYTSGYATFSGFYSGENAIVSSADSSMSVQLYSMCGNVTIICNSGHTCSIICYESGCNRAIFNDNNGTGTFIFYCNNNPQESDACPGSFGRVLSNFMIDEGYNESIFNPTMQIIGEKLTSLERGLIDRNENIYDPCNETTANAIHCANDVECASINVTNDIGPICCSGSQSCEHSDGIKTRSNLSVLNSSDIIDNTAIRCDGYESCEYGTLLANAGDIFFAASDSGRLSNTSANNGDVYVTGDYGGHLSDIKRGKTICCLGRSGCSGATIYESKDIWVVGRLSFSHGTASNITNEIHCHGEYSCIGASFTNVGNSVYAAGYHAMHEAIISNISGSLLGWGCEVFSNSSIVNVVHVCVEHLCLSLHMFLFSFFFLLLMLPSQIIHRANKKLVFGCFYNGCILGGM